jgi:hypothetical protein
MAGLGLARRLQEIKHALDVVTCREGKHVFLRNNGADRCVLACIMFNPGLCGFERSVRSGEDAGPRPLISFGVLDGRLRVVSTFHGCSPCSSTPKEKAPLQFLSGLGPRPPRLSVRLGPAGVGRRVFSWSHLEPVACSFGWWLMAGADLF